MWLLALIPIAAVATYLFAESRKPATAKAPAPSPSPFPAASPAQPSFNPAASFPVPGSVIPAGGGINPILSGPANFNPTVDGHGTGLIPEVASASQTSGVDPGILAQMAAQAASLAQGGASGGGVAGAAASAETTRIAIMEALNTPEGARTPEQIALLLAVGSLPVLG